MLVGTRENGLKSVHIYANPYDSLDCDSEVESFYANGVHFNFLFKTMLMQHIQTLYLTL